MPGGPRSEGLDDLTVVPPATSWLEPGRAHPGGPAAEGPRHRADVGALGRWAQPLLLARWAAAPLSVAAQLPHDFLARVVALPRLEARRHDRCLPGAEPSSHQTAARPALTLPAPLRPSSARGVPVGRGRRPTRLVRPGTDGGDDLLPRPRRTRPFERAAQAAPRPNHGLSATRTRTGVQVASDGGRVHAQVVGDRVRAVSARAVDGAGTRPRSDPATSYRSSGAPCPHPATEATPAPSGGRSDLRGRASARWRATNGRSTVAGPQSPTSLGLRR
jgi:hypothetical protein